MPMVSHGGQMSTYLKGTIVHKTKTMWVVQTPQARYWISVKRPPSHTKKFNDIETGFWVQMKDIKRVRPNTCTSKNS
jgi:Holliday junction resolvasome RuvABC DNA-binding subunit